MIDLISYLFPRGVSLRVLRLKKLASNNILQMNIFGEGSAKNGRLDT